MKNMDYNMEQVLMLAGRLTDKFTSKESTSVTEETARMLVEAVIYFLNEAVNSEFGIINVNHALDLEPLYKRGCEIVIEKTYEVKSLYEAVIEDFEGYSCENYMDTILNGIPAFLLNYDPKFNPQDHILTLDYPLITGFENLSKLAGVDLILYFLNGIKIEKSFLDCFDRRIIIKLLKNTQTSYEKLYYGNICDIVLLNSIGCVIADRPVNELLLKHKDYNDIYLYFKSDSLEDIADKTEKIMYMILNRITDIKDKLSYFKSASKNYAPRILNGNKNNCLENIFISEKTD